MAIHPSIRLVIAIVLTGECTVSVLMNIFVAIVLARTKRLRQLSIGYLVIFAAINDAILSLSLAGATIAEWRSYFNISVISQQQCYFENMCKLQSDCYLSEIL
jgi:hypothetical protein